jgi:SNF2 family DNA or RNA helicase
MGLGKTIQAAVALDQLVAERPDVRALVVAPAPLLLQWRSELRRWAPNASVSTVRGSPEDRAWQWRRADANVFLIGYETLAQDFTRNPQAPVAREWDLVVLDEAQRIKNRGTNVAHTCKLLHRRRAWALTGTPLENSIDELTSILEFVRPMPRGIRPRTLTWGTDLAQYHRQVQLRRRKADVLPNLPPKTILPVSIELDPKQAEAYDRAERLGIVRLRELGAEVRVTHILELIVRLKQICNLDPASRRSAKLSDLRERLSQVRAEGSRALVFSQFADDAYGAARIAAGLAEFEPLVYTGEPTFEHRAAIIEQFRRDTRSTVLVLSLRAGGVGLNLQEASYVFHFDRWWNPAVEAQAEDRSHRIGQANPVFVYPYVAAGTIEERIDAILREKRELFSTTIDPVSIDGSELRRLLTDRELFGLFNLAPGAR